MQFLGDSHEWKNSLALQQVLIQSQRSFQKEKTSPKHIATAFKFPDRR